MIEIFDNVRDEVKEIAENAWINTMSFSNPHKAAEFLHSVISYYKGIYTEEEVDFLQFYFKMKMEMMNK